MHKIILISQFLFGHADNSENIQSKLSIDWLSGAKLDSQVGHWLHLGLGAQVALEVLVVLALQAHPAERPWVKTCHAGVDLTKVPMPNTTSSHYITKKCSGGSKRMVSWAAKHAFRTFKHRDSFLTWWTLTVDKIFYTKVHFKALFSITMAELCHPLGLRTSLYGVSVHPSTHFKQL